MFDEQYFLPLHACMQFKILALIVKAQRRLAPEYLVDVIPRPHSASSNRPFRPLNRLDILVPHSRTALARS